MTPDAASLDRLHDLVLPGGVPWWPPAPGWYVVLGVAFVLMLRFFHRAWRRWQAQAYRRAALSALSASSDAAAIAELLRRTALAILPRDAVARMAGSAWVDWLARQCPEPMPPEVRELLAAVIYGDAAAQCDVAVLRDYAVRWVATHRPCAAGVGRTE